MNKTFGSLQNLLMGNQKATIPSVGDGCTIIMYSDRKACTVVDVRNNGREIAIQEDTAVRTDSNGMSDAQSYRYEPNLDGTYHQYTLRKNGSYHRAGDSMKSPALLVGARRHYYDYSF